MGVLQARRSLDGEWAPTGERLGMAGSWMDEAFPCGSPLPSAKQLRGEGAASPGAMSDPAAMREPHTSPARSNTSAPAAVQGGDYDGVHGA